MGCFTAIKMSTYIYFYMMAVKHPICYKPQFMTNGSCL